MKGKENYLQENHTCRMGLFSKIVNNLLCFIAWGSIFDVWLEYEHVSAYSNEWGGVGLGGR